MFFFFLCKQHHANTLFCAAYNIVCARPCASPLLSEVLILGPRGGNGSCPVLSPSPMCWQAGFPLLTMTEYNLYRWGICCSTHWDYFRKLGVKFCCCSPIVAFLFRVPRSLLLSIPLGLFTADRCCRMCNKQKYTPRSFESLILFSFTSILPHKIHSVQTLCFMLVLRACSTCSLSQLYRI